MRKAALYTSQRTFDHGKAVLRRQLLVASDLSGEMDNSKQPGFTASEQSTLQLDQSFLSEL